MKAWRSPMRSPSTSSRPSTTCRTRQGRRNRRSLIRVLVVHRRDGPVPRAAVLFEQFLSRGNSSRDDLLQRAQITRLVAAVVIEPLAPDQSLLGERKRFPGDVEQRTVADRSLETLLRHIVAQLLALVGGPILHDVPASIEVGIVVNQPDPICRQRRQPPPWSAVRAAHLDVAL